MSYHICFHIFGRIRIRIRIISIMSDKIWLMSTSQIYDLSIRTRIRYRMLNIRIRIRTDLNPSKRIRSRIRSENIRTVFIPMCYYNCTVLLCLPQLDGFLLRTWNSPMVLNENQEHEQKFFSFNLRWNFVASRSLSC